MADQHYRRQELLARRESRRARLRRRRRIAAALVLGVPAFAIVVVLLVSSASGPERAASGATQGDPASAEFKVPGPVPNATPQPDWEPHRGPVPIVEYHVLGEAPEGTQFPELFVTRKDFHQQMDWLDENGFEAVTLDQVEAAWYEGAGLPPKPVVISFDDGYRPQFTYALPELYRHGWAGVLSLKAEGSDLYRSNVEEMLKAGWELASHTIDHSDLTMLEGEALEREVAGSRQLLQDEFDASVDNFCYPAGRFDQDVIDAVEAAGYEAAMSQVRGFAEKGDRYRLARLEIVGSAGVDGFAAMLEGEGG